MKSILLRAGVLSSACAVVVSLVALPGCSSKEATWTLSTAKATVAPDNHVAVEIVYTNNGEEKWTGSRCVVVEWQKGAVQTREDVRAQKAPSGTVEIIDTIKWCLGGNSALDEGKSDTFNLVSGKLQPALAGSTIVVVGQDVKGTAQDDRMLIPSP
jgi:hypothetical protein